jgi:hypothetical protein
MEIISVTELNKQRNGLLNSSEGNPEIIHHLQIPSEKKEYIHNPFIEANTKEVDLHHLKNENIVPTFAKDNNRTIAHFEFIQIAQECISKIYPHHTIELPEIRVSHKISGRIPEAMHKPVRELMDYEKTQFWERCAFIIRIPSITESINGNDLSLTIGGVRSFSKENLYGKKTYEKFQVFLGFQNMVCCNLCISTDGYQEEMRVGNYSELQSKILELIQNYNAENYLLEMKQLSQHNLTEQQFAQLIGRARLYHYLPKKEKSQIPELLLNDGQISTVAKDYYLDDSFCRNEAGNINLWNVYNLFTGANKSSYIDSFLSRNVNAFEFTNGLENTLNGDSNYSWFLS